MKAGTRDPEARTQTHKPTSLQAFKLQAANLQAFGQGFKLQARVHKLQDPGARVQAYKLAQGTSNKDIGISGMLHVEGYLVRGEPHKIGIFRRCNF